jgi:hypothetical protein
MPGLSYKGRQVAQCLLGVRLVEFSPMGGSIDIRSGVASLANQHLSGNEKVLYYMHKHHHLDDDVTQPPVCFVKIKELVSPKHRASALDVLPLCLRNSLP